MAIAKKCDHCGEFYVPYDLSKKEEFFNKKNNTTRTYLLEIKTSVLDGQKLVEYDLCKECLNTKLKSFCDDL